MTGFGTGLLGVDALYFCIVPLCSFSGRNPLETRAPFASLNIAIIQTLTGGMRTHGRERGGCTVQQTQCRPISRNLERTCAEKLEVKARNKLHTSSIRLKSVLKFMRNKFPFPFIPHCDVIFQQISKYEPHVSNKKGDTTASQQMTGRNAKGCGYFILACGTVKRLIGNYIAAVST